MARLVMPATLADLAECAGNCSARTWSFACAQHANGPSYALRDEAGKAIAVAGLSPLAEEDCAEAWFMVSAEGMASKRMRAVLRAIALTLPAAGYRAIRVVTDTPAGSRIARASGFSRYDEGHDMEVWIWASGFRDCSAAAATARRCACSRSRRRPRSAGRLPISPGSRPSSTSRPRPAARKRAARS